jgi:hypothetical protein
MTSTRRRRRVSTRSKILSNQRAGVGAKSVQKYQQLLVELIELEDENPALSKLRPERLSQSLAVTRHLLEGSAGTYRVTARPESQRGAALSRWAAGREMVEAKQNNGNAESIRRVTERLGEALRAAHADLRSVDVSRLVSSMMRVVPGRSESNELADRIGPFYDTGGLTTWLGKSRQAIDKQVHAGKLLACLATDRVRLYPTWQFTENGELIPGLRDVLGALHTGTQDGWTQAIWLLTPTPELDGTALEWLTSRRDPSPVIEMARDDAAVWAS